MRTLSMVSLFAFVLMFAATVVQPDANGVSTGDFHQPSIMVDQLTANAKNLPLQSFDAF